MMDESDKYAAPPPTYDEQGNYSTSHTTTTTTTETARLHLNKDYIKTIPAILKIIQAVTSLVCMICGAIGGGSPGGWGGFVAGWVFFFALIWFFLYLFNLVSKIPPIRILIEWIYYLVLSILFLIAAIVAAVYASVIPALGAYAFFGFICTAALIVDLGLQFRVWRTEGHTVTTHTTTTTNTDAHGSTTVTSDIRY